MANERIAANEGFSVVLRGPDGEVLHGLGEVTVHADDDTAAD